MTRPDFDQIYEAHKQKVWKLAARFVNSRPDQEDLFQEIFLKINKALPKFRGEASLNTWIFRLAVNTALNFIKKQKRYRALKDLLSWFRPEEMPESRIPEERLSLPLNKLNPQQRMILILSDVEELKLEEIARLLGLPVGTVKSNLHRSREIIKKELEKNEGL